MKALTALHKPPVFRHLYVILRGLFNDHTRGAGSVELDGECCPTSTPRAVRARDKGVTLPSEPKT